MLRIRVTCKGYHGRISKRLEILLMNIPKSNKVTEVFFRSLLPEDSRIVIRPMFGNDAAFISGNMFAGTFGVQTFVRLPEDLGAELLKEKGSSGFSPMKGRPMRGYIVIPAAWSDDPDEARAWVLESFKWVSGLPAKKKKG